jgi:hypothetical protein
MFFKFDSSGETIIINCSCYHFVCEEIQPKLLVILSTFKVVRITPMGETLKAHFALEILIYLIL